MSDYHSVFSAAQQLPQTERQRLIDDLWDTLPPDSEAPFSEEWLLEIDRRLDELDAGTAQTTLWTQIRDEALARIGYDKAD